MSKTGVGFICLLLGVMIGVYLLKHYPKLFDWLPDIKFGAKETPPEPTTPTTTEDILVRLFERGAYS